MISDLQTELIIKRPVIVNADDDIVDPEDELDKEDEEEDLDLLDDENELDEEEA